MIDGSGVYGSVFHYAMVIFFFFGAILIFLVLWKNKRLDFDEEAKFDMMEEEKETELEEYGDPNIASYDRKVPVFLKWTYLLLPIWGFVVFYFFWNGSVGWFDRGHWKSLQEAARTTFPIEK